MSTENKYSDQAKEKIKAMVKDIKIGLLATNLDHPPISAVPMMTSRVGVEGEIWFLSSGVSEHNRNIVQNGSVQLFYAKPTDSKFLNINGRAEIVAEDSILSDLYESMANTWFDGPKDPNLTAIKVTPREAYYWDPKSNKYITLFKMGISAVTGKHTDVGNRGKLDV